MRLSIILVAALLAGGCGFPGADKNAGEDVAMTGVTVELPPEPPAPAAPAVAEKPPEAEAPPEAPTPEAPPPEAAEPEAKPESTKPPLPDTAPAPPQPDPAPEPAEPPAETRSTAARPPLPDAVVARTIDRIGYRCGSVVSAGREGGTAAGEPVYRINCSSGETYRGTTRRGRLFFRPWDDSRR